MLNSIRFISAGVLAASVALGSSAAMANSDPDWQGGGGSACSGLPSHSQLKAALIAAQAQKNGGFSLEMWGTIVNRDGIVCAVAFTGADRGSQWPGSRVISAQKANTANSFSLPGLALSTADLYAATQPGGSLFGLQASNPVDTINAYQGPSKNFGQPDDPLVGQKIGGINVFGGGFALYNSKGKIVGGIGVSGDTSCADHNIGWRTRNNLKLDFIPGGIGVNGDDNINYIGLVLVPSVPNDFSHPICTIGGTDYVSSISANLPKVEVPKP